MQHSAAKLTPKQEKAITVLLTQPTIEAAATSLGINPATVHRWLQDRPFADAYRSARRDAVGQAVTRLQQVSGAAVAVLVQVMADKRTAGSTRVAAASKVLDYAFRAVELEDLAARIEALEQQRGPQV